MRRKTFDAMVSTGGLVLAAILLIAGGLLVWAHSFVDNNVHTQLSQQQIFFPDKAGIAAQKSAEITKYVTPYATQQVLNGKQAQVFANHYIAIHLSELPMGGVYSKLSAAARANPSDQTLAAAVDTSFKGTTLRGMLLNAYAFWKIGQIAMWGAVSSFIAAGLLLLLSALGFLHLRRTSPEAEVLPKLGARTPAPVER
jgi:hypothetical protein